ncbi:DUF4136 domain-containing protein [Sphingomonas sp.]|uniref:DUF4136 domain-containing protein n=1 Tax=Sphingomonas sp. TaxID=28214 RepID=UPI003AFF7E28
MRAKVALLAVPFLLAAPLLASCATTGGGSAPTDVIRYHLGQPLERGTVVVQSAAGGDGLSGQPYEEAVARALGTAGYTPAAPGGEVQFIALVEVRQISREERRPSPFSIGLGGGGFSGGRSGGVGLGGGIGFPIGRGRRTTIDATELTVLIKRRVDQSPVWEGHARTVAPRAADMRITADKLATAVFTGFPGESGRTITVR